MQRTYDSLVEPYLDYCTTVSHRSMAMSIESCTYLLHLCRRMGAETVCDLGSGFTSYTLARYAAEVDYPVRIVSVDDNPEWLERTAEFLDRHDLPTDGLTLWPDWKPRPEHFDVVCHDFSGGLMRNRSMVYAAARTRKAILFDDMNHPSHSPAMLAVCRRYGLTTVDVRGLTSDQVGRFARLAVRTLP